MKTNNRILIIDDDPGIRNAYRDMLEPPKKTAAFSKKVARFDEPGGHPGMLKERYALSITDKGDRGVAAVKASLAQNRPFATVFIDLRMPGMDDAETARLIRQHDPHIKITIAAAHSVRSSDGHIRATGCDDLFYLRKPFNREDIRQVARTLTHVWNLEREQNTLSGQLKKANQRLADINRDMEKRVRDQTALLIQSQKMASISNLAAGVAHEINNPISYVNGNLNALKKYGRKIVNLLEAYQDLEMVAQQNGEADLHEQLKKVRQYRAAEGIDFILEDLDALVDESLEGIDRVHKIVTDLRTLPCIDEAKPEPIDINGCLDATLNIIWDEVKCHAEVMKDYETLPEMIGCPQKISQVFMNILINATKAINNKGQIHISTEHVKAGRRKSDDKIVITIADNGMGIPKNLLDKIFDPFFTTKPVGEGTGLGLSISYNIIKAHGGSIRFQSKEGEGTKFTISLPVTPPKVQTIDPPPNSKDHFFRQFLHIPSTRTSILSIWPG
jgi:two-component system NtrC family sensor kinase